MCGGIPGYKQPIGDLRKLPCMDYRILIIVFFSWFIDYRLLIIQDSLNQAIIMEIGPFMYAQIREHMRS